MLDGQNPVIALIDLLEAMQAPVNVSAACIVNFTYLRDILDLLGVSKFESIINNPLKPLPQKYEEIGSEIWALSLELEWLYFSMCLIHVRDRNGI